VKPNVLVVGPSGCGKTHLVRTVAKLIGVPFVKVDATKFSATGYVGGDVEDPVRALVAMANGDVALAEVVGRLERTWLAPARARALSLSPLGITALLGVWRGAVWGLADGHGCTRVV
jgi:energy-coupling factor transporter ATP-binding protein EcfA2